MIDDVVVPNETPQAVTVSSPQPSAVTVTSESPATVQVTNISPSTVSVPHNVNPLQVSVTNGPSGASGEAKNLIMFMADDISLVQMPTYEDLSEWPANMLFPAMPFFMGDVMTKGMRFTNARVNARCSPTRASQFTGRLGHISNVGYPGTSDHLWGTGIGDVQGQTPADQVPFWEGMKAEHRPWPAVAKLAGARHEMVTGPKYHLYEQTAPGEGNIVDRRNPVTIAGFDYAIQSNLTGQGEPTYGYFDNEWWLSHTDSIHDTTGFTPSGVFTVTWFYEKLVEWLELHWGPGGDQAPLVVNWWMHLPHGNPPAFDQFVGPGGERVHTTYTEAELVPNTTSADGKVASGDPRWGHDAAGVADGVGDYTEYGAIHIFARRVLALTETMDYFTKKLSDLIENTYPEQYAKTLFMHYSDNGMDKGVLALVETTSEAARGPNFANVFPPTSDGTTAGTPFYAAEDAKGSMKDLGIRSHLHVWGGALPVARQGTDCDALIGACDFMPTILDILSPGSWRTAMGADYDFIDGESFYQRIFDGAHGDQEYTYATVFSPGWIADENHEVYDFDRCVIFLDKTDPTNYWKLRREYVKDPDTGIITTTKVFYLYDIYGDPRELDDKRSLYGSDATVTAIMDQMLPFYWNMFGTH